MQCIFLGISSNKVAHIFYWIVYDQFINILVKVICSLSLLPFLKNRDAFLDTHVSLAPTHVSLLVGRWYFWISILSASLVALREKLKREDPNYFSILGLGKISRNWSGVGGGDCFDP